MYVSYRIVNKIQEDSRQVRIKDEFEPVLVEYVIIRSKQDSLQ
jgi:hypothetical protein